MRRDKACLNQSENALKKLRRKNLDYNPRLINFDKNANTPRQIIILGIVQIVVNHGEYVEVIEFKKGDRVIVRGIHLALIVDGYLDQEYGTVTEPILILTIECDRDDHRIYAKESVVLLNNAENCRAEGWIK